MVPHAVTGYSFFLMAATRRHTGKWKVPPLRGWCAIIILRAK